MSNNLTKKDIVLNIYKEMDVEQATVREIVQRTLDAIEDALVEGRNVELRRFGVFEVQVRKARVGRNPKDPEKDVIIPDRPVVKFKLGNEFKKRLMKKGISSYQK